MQQRVNMVSLGVEDVGRARAFYEYGLGWQASDRSSRSRAVFRAGDMLVGLVPNKALASDMGFGEPSAPTAFNGFALSYAVASPEEAMVLLAKAKAAGGTVARRGEETQWGGYAGTFTDPDGHAWELVWHPDWFDDKGSPLIE